MHKIETRATTPPEQVGTPITTRPTLTNAAPGPKVYRGGGRYDPDRASDLRRKRGRDLVATLVERAAYLPQDERELIVSVYRDSRKITEVAALLDIPPRRLSVRVRKLVKRLLDPRFAFVARNREHWPRTRRRVGTMRVLFGRTMRQTADDLGLTLHQIRQHEAAIHALHEAERDAAHDLAESWDAA